MEHEIQNIAVFRALQRPQLHPHG